MLETLGELNFPIGPKTPLPLGSDRWLFVLHLLECVFYSRSENEQAIFSQVTQSKPLEEILIKIRAAFQEGFEESKIQRKPYPGEMLSSWATQPHELEWLQ